MSESRERKTRKKIRSIDTWQIVELVHRLEDDIAGLKAKLAAAESQPAVQEECKKCGDKLRHDDDGPDVCRWCSSGFVRSDDLECALSAGDSRHE